MRCDGDYIYWCYLHFFIGFQLLTLVKKQSVERGGVNKISEEYLDGDICERILNLMEYKRRHYGNVFFRTKDIASDLDISVRQCREHLDYLSLSGVVGGIPATVEVPVLWFVL